MNYEYGKSFNKVKRLNGNIGGRNKKLIFLPLICIKPQSDTENLQ